MEITIEYDDKSYVLDVPPALPLAAGDFFERMNQDMDRGWQMSRWWVPDPDRRQRCQIVADKLLTAMHNDNREFALLMCAYILDAMPDTRRIRINIDGEIQGNEFFDA